MMIRVGITGGIGSGKSLVCSILEACGVPVYYADSEARRLMNADSALREAIKDMLGENAYRDGELDRQMVGQMVFGDSGLLEKLNALVHPVVGDDFLTWCTRWEGVSYVVEEAAILFESGASSHLDMSVLVYAPSQLRIKRVMERDGASLKEVEKRIQMQMDEEEKLKLADRVIFNDGKNLLLPQIVDLHEDLIKRI